jgi:hypothetical protein
MKYTQLTASNPDLMRINRVRDYFDKTGDIIAKLRYADTAHFIQASSEVYASMGAYGTGPCYLGKREPNALSRKTGYFYRSCPLRDTFILVNDQGEVDTVIRRLFLNTRQFYQKFPGEELPKCMKMATKSGGSQLPSDNDYYEFIHVVHPRDDFDPKMLTVEKYPIAGNYLCVKDVCYVGEEEGYRSLPYLTPRTFTEPGDPYGFSPANQALAAMGTASAIKKVTLKQGQKAVDPVLLAHDDGVLNGPVDLRPGHVNYGAVDRQGRKLIHALDTGNFNVSEKLIQDERADIEDSFFVYVFKLLEQNKEMTATEIVERARKETALMSPTMGRLQTEFVAKFHDRELDLADEMGVLPEIPPELQEANGEYEIIYTSPMAKNMYADEVSGFMRSTEMTLNIVNATGDPSHLDHFNFDVALPEISDHMAVPARWMNDDDKKKQLAEARKAQQEQESLMKNAGALAGAAKTAQQMEGSDA